MAALQGTTAFMVRDKYSSVCCKCAEHPYAESDLRFKSLLLSEGMYLMLQRSKKYRLNMFFWFSDKKLLKPSIAF